MNFHSYTFTNFKLNNIKTLLHRAYSLCSSWDEFHEEVTFLSQYFKENENSALPLGLEPCKFPGLHKPAVPDPRQDLTVRPFRVNNSGSSLSSPPHLQPYSKPFSGRPARPYMTCPTREAGGALRQRSGIIYLLLPRAQRPDTNVAIDATLPEAAAVGHQDLPPTVVEIGTTSQPQTGPSSRRRASRKPSLKCSRNRSAGVFRPPKRSPPQGHLCD